MLARKISENRLRDKYGLRKNELKRRERDEDGDVA